MMHAPLPQNKILEKSVYLRFGKIQYISTTTKISQKSIVVYTCNTHPYTLETHVRSIKTFVKHYYMIQSPNTIDTAMVKPN